MLRAVSLAVLLSAPVMLRAETPRVVTDLLPVQSLAAMVIGDLGAPEVLVTPGTSGHAFALRPSQARALDAADLVIWVGPEMTPGLVRPIGSLGRGAVLGLAEVPGIRTLPFRDGGLFAHDHGGGHDHEEEGAHDDDHGHDDDHAHDDGHETDEAHAKDENQAHEAEAHDHGAEAHIDPHLWLDPENGALWLTAIAEALSDLDPDNAATYAANAEAGAARIAEARATAEARLATVKDRPLGVAHDAFQYYEAAFGLTVVGAVTDGDDAAPGAARLDLLRDAYAAAAPTCVLTDPGTDERLIRSVTEGIPEAPALVTIDPLGSDLPQGAALYPALIEETAARIAECGG